MRCAIVSLFFLVPPLHGQIAGRTDSLFFSAPPAPRAALLLDGVAWYGPSLGKDQSISAGMFERSRGGRPWSPRALGVPLVLDSARSPQGHAWLGAVLGLGLGAGIGYLVAVPRVRATERHSDGGPFQQVEYVIDPIVGGLIGTILGIAVGSHLR